MFCCKFCEIFKNTYFEEHLRTATSEQNKCEQLLLQLILSIKHLRINQPAQLTTLVTGKSKSL